MKKSLVNKLFKNLYPIVDADYSKYYDAFTLTEFFLEAGYKIIQLRQKSLSPKQFLDLAMEISYLKLHNDFKLIINQYVDIAEKINADGVHLTYQSISTAEARNILGEDKIIGKSFHQNNEFFEEELELLDYLTIGPVFSTHSKSKDFPLFNLDRLSEIKSDLPKIAIGGINASNMNQIRSKVDGFCCLSSVLSKKDCLESIRKLNLKT